MGLASCADVAFSTSEGAQGLLFPVGRYPGGPRPESRPGNAAVEESVAKILRTLELMGHIEASESQTEYSEEEEEEIKKRLADLGYI